MYYSLSLLAKRFFYGSFVSSRTPAAVQRSGSKGGAPHGLSSPAVAIVAEAFGPASSCEADAAAGPVALVCPAKNATGGARKKKKGQP